MQVFTNFQFKFFWLLSAFCYVLFLGEVGWGQSLPMCPSRNASGECCSNFDRRSQRCMKVETSRVSFREKFDSSSTTVVTNNMTNDGRCKAELNGTNGCYTLRSSANRNNIPGCDIGRQYCRSEAFCRANTPKNDNYWNPKTRKCQDTPVEAEVAREETATEPESQPSEEEKKRRCADCKVRAEEWNSSANR